MGLYDWQMKSGLEKPPSVVTDWLDGALVVALGSNQTGGFVSSEALLEAALTRLTELGFRRFARSSWWRSKAWPDPDDPDFTNGVALFHPEASPAETLATLLEVEREFGRTRGRISEPRTLDLDLIAYGRTIEDGEALILPHPRAHERLFVMGPLAEVAPMWRHPNLDETAQSLAKRAKVGADARPITYVALHKNP